MCLVTAGIQGENITEIVIIDSTFQGGVVDGDCVPRMAFNL